MTSRVLREIPLKILQRKVGDEHVTLLQACYDNPIFNQDETKGFPTHNGNSRSGKPSEYGADLFEDGVVDARSGSLSSAKHSTSCHVANDYMHSLTSSRPLPNDITFRAHRKRSRLLILLLLCLVLVIAMTIGLLVFFLGNESSSSLSSHSPSSPPVINLANVQGSLTFLAGPFGVYNQDMSDTSSRDYNFLRTSFIYMIDRIFMSSKFASLYKKAQILHVGEKKGHVQLSFHIIVQPNSTARSDLISQLKSLLIRGFRNSIFTIDEENISLWGKAINPVLTTPVPGQCQPVVVSMCANKTDYYSTSYPNILGHRSPQEVETFYKQNHDNLFPNPNCYGYLTDFYCSIYAPECGSGGAAIPPCKKYCQDVMKECTYVLRNYMPFSCDQFPDSTDPNVCRQNPYKPATCVPPSSTFCQHVGNYSMVVFPNVFGAIAVDDTAIFQIKVIEEATHCFKHSLLYACTLFEPPCTGRPYPHHLIPPCASLCQAYTERCSIFRDIFKQYWPSPLNCSHFPDSPDASVCVGYHQAREPDISACSTGEIPCDKNRCIKTSWLCDGFQDCDDNSDEAHCAMCGPEEQSCSPASSLCIHKSQACDGANNCYMDVDEHFCVKINTEQESDFLEVYNAVSSEWEEVCRDNWSQDFSALACRQLGYKNELATYYKPQSSAKKSMLASLKNASDPNRLQSYMDKGYKTCPSGYVVRIVCLDSVCGTRPAYFQKAARIVGGDEANPGTWPWMVSLYGGKAQKFFCGATIIHPEWILTAGHCVGGATYDTDYWTIIAGNTRRHAYSEVIQVRKPKAFYNYNFSSFDFKTMDHDIALIHLDKPFAFNDFVRPICLPEKLPEVGTRCYATGWGKTEDNAIYYEAVLRQVALDISSWDYCKHAIATYPEIPYNLTKTMFCAGGSQDHDACQGDSGGPLVCRQENATDQWYQGGIVSWGVVCGRRNTPGVYTNLPLYIDWIKDVIANFTSR